MAGSSIKFSVQIQPRPSDEELLFVKQLGVDYVYACVDADRANVKSLSELRLRVEDAGLTLYDVYNRALFMCDKIHLALPGRDDAIGEYKSFISNLGGAGIPVTTFTWMPAGVWSSGIGESRGAKCRRVDLNEMLKRPLSHGRKYTEEEIWDNFSYFMEKIIPVAEEAGVRLGLHQTIRQRPPWVEFPA
jgi:mannonate dehydratase